METRVSVDFLQTLFGQIPDDTRFYLWKLSTKTTTWFARSEIEKAASMSERQTNLYAGVSIAAADIAASKGERQRIKKNEAIGSVAVFSDVDFGSEGHKKEGNPPDVESAKYLIDQIEIRPTQIIHSGNGLQAWWVFDVPWMFYDPSVRQEAQDLSERWNRMFAAIAAEHGWSMDSTYDLSRVLRVPGTYNYKAEATSKIVKVYEYTGDRYTVSQIESIIPEAVMTKGITVQKLTREIEISVHAEPPYKKMLLLSDIDPRFKESIDRNRTDTAMRDRSNSGYDLSIASIAARAGWDDQEIANTIIWSRKKTSTTTDIRKDYLARTINTAREGKQQTSDEFIERIEKIESNGSSKDEILELINSQLETQIIRIVRYVSSPPYKYAVFTLDGGSVDLPSAECLITQGKLRNYMADVGVLLPPIKADKWHNMAKLLLAVVDNEDAGESESEQIETWLVDYIRSRTVLDDLDNATKDELPFKDEEGIWISAAWFRSYLYTSSLETHHTQKTIGMALRAAGCVRKTFVLGEGLRISRRSMWRIPSNIRESE